MDTTIAVLKVIHILNAILMAWPFYALVAVNQRALLGPPLGDRADTYMENIIKNRTVPCFVFQATALITGVALVIARGEDLGALVTNPMLAGKFLLLLLIIGLLGFVYRSLQPRIDALFAQAGAAPVPADIAPRIAALRLRRKQTATVCMFVVLTVSMLGVQAWAAFPLWLTIVLLVAIAAFTWRSYKSVTPYGWY
ncbi:MAG: hypothetical protein HYU75_19585 [Betaproteobacteria bacterium]|nr:hypothetical protein [Betaproteobacteria bacterium]